MSTDFHGDGIDGEVYVVGTNSSLPTVEHNISRGHLKFKQPLQFGSVGSCGFSSPGSLGEFVETGPTTTPGDVGREYLSSSGGSVASAPDAPVSHAGLGSLAWLGPSNRGRLCARPQHAFATQKPVHRECAASDAIGDVSRALSGEVAFDDVIFVGEREFAGHVYNLQTTLGFYTASLGHIITHNCRSVMVSILSPDGIAEQIGERPFVRDARTRKEREKDFRSEAREKVGDAKWKTLDAKQRNAEIAKLRRKWTDENIGIVPAQTSYREWLKTQPREFVEDVLGKKRAKLFLEGKVDLDQFVDRNGAVLSLEQLAKRNPVVRGDAQ